MDRAAPTALTRSDASSSSCARRKNADMDKSVTRQLRHTKKQVPQMFQPDPIINDQKQDRAQRVGLDCYTEARHLQARMRQSAGAGRRQRARPRSAATANAKHISKNCNKKKAGYTHQNAHQPARTEKVSRVTNCTWACAPLTKLRNCAISARRTCWDTSRPPEPPPLGPLPIRPALERRSSMRALGRRESSGTACAQHQAGETETTQPAATMVVQFYSNRCHQSVQTDSIGAVCHPTSLSPRIKARSRFLSTRLTMST